MICQARTSYLNKEINWGYRQLKLFLPQALTNFRFMPMLFLDQHHFSADHSMFHSTYEVRMPVHSAMESEARKKGYKCWMVKTQLLFQLLKKTRRLNVVKIARTSAPTRRVRRQTCWRLWQRWRRRRLQRHHPNTEVYKRRINAAARGWHFEGNRSNLVPSWSWAPTLFNALV